MLTVVNKTTMQHIVTTLGMDMPVAVAWAETVPYQNDFSILMHTADQLAPYTDMELYNLFTNLGTLGGVPNAHSRAEFIGKLVKALNELPTTSEMPPDGKRVAPLPTQEESNEMTKKATKKVPAKKAPVKKVPAKKVPAKKAPVKKAPVKKAPAKVERTSKNGVLTPKPESQTGKVFAICDAQSKKAGAPAIRADVVAACVKAGVKEGTATAAYQIWRNYNGLVKSRS